jgi:hypothetical protein
MSSTMWYTPQICQVLCDTLPKYVKCFVVHSPKYVKCFVIHSPNTSSALWYTPQIYLYTQLGLLSLYFSLFTTCFVPYGPSSGKMQHHLHFWSTINATTDPFFFNCLPTWCESSNIYLQSEFKFKLSLKHYNSQVFPLVVCYVIYITSFVSITTTFLVFLG